MCSVRINKTFALNVRNRLQLNSTREWLQNRKLLWFGPLNRMEESSSSSKPQNFVVGDSLVEGQFKQTKSV